MKASPYPVLSLSLLLVLGNPALADVDLMVTNLFFEPRNVETLTYPDRVRFTLGNYGPSANCDFQMDFILSTNATAGDADDRLLSSFVRSACLDPGQSGTAELPTVDRALLTMPMDAVGAHYLLLRVSPVGDTDPDAGDNVAVATNLLVVPPPAPIFAALANSSIATGNLNLYPGINFAYNSYYGNCWRISGPGGGFTATFNAPSAGAYTLRVRHATSSSAGCPNNGYAPVNISLNGASVVTDYDVAAAHASYWFENDTWTIQAIEGENTLAWTAGGLCTHYWLQRLDVWPVVDPPQIESIQPMGPGQYQLTITGQAGRTNVIEVSSNLVSWTAVTNVFNDSGSMNWLDAVAPVGETRFYRLLQMEP